MMGLNELIRQVAEQYDTVDPRDLAYEVARAAPSRQLRDLLTEAIVDDCRQHLMGQRNDALDVVRRTNRSARLSRQRDWWADILASGVHVGNGKWSTIGECTADDLRFCIDERTTEMTRIQSRIDQYEQLLSLMLAHKVIHVRDLPRDAVESGFAA